MSVTVHEGLPGCGKTLRVLSLVRDFIRRDKRPVYLFNFKITDKGLEYFKALAEENQVVFEVRPERFSELNIDLPEDEKTGYVTLRKLNILDGAVIVLDEAQMFFPVRASSKTPPSMVKMLPTHRHSGYDIHFITQNKAFLDIDIRRIADTYVKYSRMMNGQFCRLEFYSKCSDNSSELAQNHLKSEHFKYPKDIFELYVSAVEHNMKFRIPAKAKLLVVALIALIGSVYLVFSALGSFSESFVGNIDKDKPASDGSAPAQSVAHPDNKPSSDKSQPQPKPNDQSRSMMAPIVPSTLPAYGSLGVGKPNAIDLSTFSIYYVGFVDFGGIAKPVLYLFDDRTSTCTAIGKDFFMAMGYDIFVTKALVVVKPLFAKSKPFVLPVMPSPCADHPKSFSPSVDLSRYRLYYSGYSILGKYQQLYLTMLNLEDGTCFVPNESFFVTYGYRITRADLKSHIILSNVQTNHKVIVPMTASPACVGSSDLKLASQPTQVASSSDSTDSSISSGSGRPNRPSAYPKPTMLPTQGIGQ